MTDYLSAFYEGATEISPDEIIGALGIGLVLAMACSGLCLLGRKKASNVFPVFCGLIFAVSAVSMVVGLGHARYKYIGSAKQMVTGNPMPGGNRFFNARPPLGWPGPQPGGTPPARHLLGRMLVHEADANHDGQLTPEEAAQYIREADHGGRGWVSPHDLDAHDLEQRRSHKGPPPPAAENPPGPPAPGPNPRGPEGR